MAGMTDILKDYIENTTKLIVDNPDEVKISVITSTKAVIAQISVGKEDCGKIIGRKGRTIEALKIICLAIKNTQYSTDSRKVLIEVLEDENSSFIRHREDD
jgi:uncharacterized protein